MSIGVNKKLIPRGGNDKVYTPDGLAIDVIEHFKDQIPKDNVILEPCRGDGAFIRALSKQGFNNIKWCEIDYGVDFFDFVDKVDWLITNPPWSLARQFMEHAYKIADNHVWLISINHVIALKRRLRDMKYHNFGIKEILLLDTPPPPWPQSGFQLGAIHVQKNWNSSIKFDWGK